MTAAELASSVSRLSSCVLAVLLSMLRSAVLSSAALGLALLLPGVTTAQTVCHAPVDLVFILDESGSVGSSNYYKSIDFMKDMVARFQVGTGATDAQVSLVKFASVVDTSFHLNTHTSNSAVVAAMAATTFNSGGTCTGWAMKIASEEVLCPTCPGRAPRNAPSIAIFLTDGNPGWLSSCNNANAFTHSGETVDRVTELERLKSIVNRIIPVGIGSGISGAYLQSLAKDMPLINGNNYITADYANLGAIMDDLATVACPTLPPTKAPTAVPTAEPSLAPTAQPSAAPTYDCDECTAAQKLTCDMLTGRPGTCGFTNTTCATAKCGCGMGTLCSDTACGTCTAAPTNSPTAFPTMSPTEPPSFAPTSAPSAPTGAPTYWDLFKTGTDDQADAAAKTTVGIASAGLGALAIIAIVLGVIAAIVLLAMIVAGVGIFAARKKLFATELTVDGKDIQRTKAIGVGQQVRSILYFLMCAIYRKADGRTQAGAVLHNPCSGWCTRRFTHPHSYSQLSTPSC